VLAEVCDRVVFAVPEGYEAGEGLERIRGGRSRSESVRLALDVLDDARIVVVHDAARPLITEELVRECIDRVEEGWDGAIAAAPMTDTVKQTDASGRVVRTFDRSKLWSIQTPQAFRAETLRRALDVDDAELAAATDDASLVEAAGGEVRVVEAPVSNIKVTHVADIARVEALLQESGRC
jgi:2-C-methyl-D-erythritol 4-phosphate cytidylyltransferase